MHTPTFRESYDKIIDAYFKDEIKPMRPDFCFCGTLHGGRGWCRNEEWEAYSAIDFILMEDALLTPLIPYGARKWDTLYRMPGQWGGRLDIELEGYEDALFIGMCAALKVLESIHKKRGEVIRPSEFKKRELAVI